LKKEGKKVLIHPILLRRKVHLLVHGRGKEIERRKRKPYYLNHEKGGKRILLPVTEKRERNEHSQKKDGEREPTCLNSGK